MFESKTSDFHPFLTAMDFQLIPTAPSSWANQTVKDRELPDIAFPLGGRSKSLVLGRSLLKKKLNNELLQSTLTVEDEEV